MATLESPGSISRIPISADQSGVINADQSGGLRLIGLLVQTKTRNCIHWEKDERYLSPLKTFLG